jgi:hypothetical protein
MIYELRTYHCTPGRLGELHDRFQKHTLRIWEKYGVKPVGFWTMVVGSDHQCLKFMLQWESLAERERIWNAFMVDPEWIAARAQYEVKGPLVAKIENELLESTAYSPLR